MKKRKNNIIGNIENQQFIGKLDRMP